MMILDLASLDSGVVSFYQVIRDYTPHPDTSWRSGKPDYLLVAWLGDDLQGRFGLYCRRCRSQIQILKIKEFKMFSNKVSAAHQEIERRMKFFW